MDEVQPVTVIVGVCTPTAHGYCGGFGCRHEGAHLCGLCRLNALYPALGKPEGYPLA